MAIQNAPAAAEEVVPSKLKVSRKKAPKSEAGQAQARLVAGLIDGFREIRSAQRAQQQNDRRLAIEDQSAARGRTSSRARSSRDDKTPEYTTKGGQLVMTDAPKRGRSTSRSAPGGRDDATPEYPIEGTVLISDIANKKAKRTPHEIMRKHHQQNPDHLRPRKKTTLPIMKRKKKSRRQF